MNLRDDLPDDLFSEQRASVDTSVFDSLTSEQRASVDTSIFDSLTSNEQASPSERQQRRNAELVEALAEWRDAHGSGSHSRWQAAQYRLREAREADIVAKAAASLTSDIPYDPLPGDPLPESSARATKRTDRERDVELAEALEEWNAAYKGLSEGLTADAAAWAAARTRARNAQSRLIEARRAITIAKAAASLADE